MFSCGPFWNLYHIIKGRVSKDSVCRSYWWRGSNHGGFCGTAVLFWTFWLPLAMLDKWGWNFNPPQHFLWRLIELLGQPQRRSHSKSILCNTTRYFRITSDLSCLLCLLAVFCCQFNLHVMHLVQTLTSIKIAQLCQTSGFHCKALQGALILSLPDLIPSLFWITAHIEWCITTNADSQAHVAFLLSCSTYEVWKIPRKRPSSL